LIDATRDTLWLVGYDSVIEISLRRVVTASFLFLQESAYRPPIPVDPLERPGSLVCLLPAWIALPSCTFPSVNISLYKLQNPSRLPPPLPPWVPPPMAAGGGVSDPLPFQRSRSYTLPSPSPISLLPSPLTVTVSSLFPVWLDFGASVADLWPPVWGLWQAWVSRRRSAADGGVMVGTEEWRLAAVIEAMWGGLSVSFLLCLVFCFYPFEGSVPVRVTPFCGAPLCTVHHHLGLALLPCIVVFFRLFQQ